MKYFDKLLKILKTDRNTFLTYILTLVSFYLCIDRVVEILFIAGTGMYVDLWGPIKYTLALACVVFAFHFSSSSKFANYDQIKLSYLYAHMIGLYIMAVSMVVQWVNAACWFGFFMVPNYSYIIENYRELIQPAFCGIAWYVPLATIFPFIMKIYEEINDTKDIRDSIMDYGGIDLSDTSKGWGPYTCELFICKDAESGKGIKIPESKRFEAMAIVGVSGSGKTSMVYEPFIARDLEKKYFLREASKEMAFTALKTGLANLNSPYSNEYINENFSLNMLSVNENKGKLYSAYMSKLILSESHGKYIYKNLGLTYMAPDYETINTIKKVAKNFGIKYHIIDPTDPQSEGINPFVFKDPIKTSLAISSVLRIMFNEESTTSNHCIDSYKQNLAIQAIENVTLLLHEMYPSEHDGEIPTLEDLIKLFYNFSEIERLSRKMESIPELAQKYELQIQYFKTNFYSDSFARNEFQSEIQAITAPLANLIRYPGIKNIICNKFNNVNYETALQNGEVVLVCTRRGDLGDAVHKAFGTFFLLLMQHSVLSRPDSERSRIPHFLYIDEFYPFISKATASIFTLYRKYRVGAIISAQNLSQFGVDGGNNFRQTILANCATKIVFGQNTPEDNEWWAEELGEKREWQGTRAYETASKATPAVHLNQRGKVDNFGLVETGQQYDSKIGGIKYAYTKNYKPGKVQSLKFKQILYKTRDTKGKQIVGKAKLDFLESRYKDDEQKIKTFNFTKFTKGIATSEESKHHDLKNIFTLSSDTDSDNPIRTNTMDLNYKFDNENAITSYHAKKNKKLESQNSED